MQDISGKTNFVCPAPLVFTVPPSGAITLAATLPKEISLFKNVKLSATMPNWAASQVSTVASGSTGQATIREMRIVCAAIQKAAVVKKTGVLSRTRK
jgi:hypothetical protein